MIEEVLIKPLEYLSIQREKETLVVGEILEIIEVGIQGPPGKAGATGQNADATFEWVTQIFDLESSQQEFVLSFEPRAGSVFVYLNGLLERFWSLTDTTVTLDDSALEGDTVTVNYQKEI